MLGVLADGLEEHRLGVLGRHPADPLECLDLLLVGLGDLFPGALDLALALDEFAVALLEHVAALVELLVALEETSLEAVELGPLGPGLVLGLALEAELLVLRLEDEVLLLVVGLLDDERGLGLGLLHPLAGAHPAQDQPATTPATAATMATATAMVRSTIGPVLRSDGAASDA